MILGQIVDNFPVRKTKRQKADFRAFAIEEAQKLGFTAVEERRGSSTNVVIGDVENAQVIITAHYDTPPVMPLPNIVTPGNIPFYLLYQVVVVALMFVIVWGIGAVVGLFTQNPDVIFWAREVTLVMLLILLMFGPANKHNVNDNTSGVAAVFETLKRVQGEGSRVAAVLFDNEEKGMLGSGAFAAMHPKAKRDAFIVNMDCVGEGENVLLVAKRRVRKREEWPLLMDAFARQTGRQFAVLRAGSSIYPSDQMMFKNGVALCACKKAPVIGYYCDKIHTKKDTVCEQVNLDFIAEGLADFIHNL